MFDVFLWDMGGHEENVQQILQELPHARTIRYLGSHLDMMRRTATRSRTEYFWVVSSCCDYSSFDFRYMPPVGQEKQLHCWATADEKFGDTFLVHLPSWQEQQNVEKLEWYQHVNYHPDGVPALPWPAVHVPDNDLAQAVKANQSAALYCTYIMPGTLGVPAVGFNKWSNKPVVAFNKTGHVSMCPRDAKAAINTQIYDWPYIMYVNDPNVIQKPQDVAFISYDEKNADDNWSRLQASCPRAYRIHGVQGLVAAIKTAAEKSTTPWFYAVFGKTEIAKDFMFDTQPDYLRRPANYVFQSYNPILDHSYGHDGVVMYDRCWMLALQSWDLDITMSHHVVNIPQVSCINRLDTSAWSAWRTAFRETYKLSYYLDKRYSIEDEYHLHLWMTQHNTDMGNWSRRGAAEGRQFYLEQRNKQDYAVNDWGWLKQRFLENQGADSTLQA